jgi:hypothetical protein
MTTNNDRPRRRHPLDIFGALRARAKQRRAIEDDVLDSARLRAIGL